MYLGLMILLATLAIIFVFALESHRTHHVDDGFFSSDLDADTDHPSFFDSFDFGDGCDDGGDCGCDGGDGGGE